MIAPRKYSRVRPSARQAETVREKDGHYNFAVEPMNWQL